MATKRIDYYDHDLERQAEYCYEYPGELELLAIFPEAKKIVREKLKDWEWEKEFLLMTETIPLFKKINALPDKFSRWFWKMSYSYLAGGYREIASHLRRLGRLQMLLANPSGAVDFEKAKLLAKETPIRDLYDFQKVRHSRAGIGFTALCPFHDDKNPSFEVFNDNKFRCWSCGEHGDSIDFIQKHANKTYPEAVMQLTERSVPSC